MATIQMSDIKVSFAILTHNETDILQKLLSQEKKSQEKKETKEELPALLTLKQKAGRLKYPKEEWGELNQEELFEYLKNKEQSI